MTDNLWNSIKVKPFFYYYLHKQQAFHEDILLVIVIWWYNAFKYINVERSMFCLECWFWNLVPSLFKAKPVTSVFMEKKRFWICLNLIERELVFLAPKALRSSYCIIWTVNLQRKHSPTVRRRRASFTVLQKRRRQEKRRQVRYCPQPSDAGRLKIASICFGWERTSEPQVSLLMLLYCNYNLYLFANIHLTDQ